MDETTHTPEQAAERYRPCGQGGCKRGWLVGQGIACSCYARLLAVAAAEFIAERQAGRR